jgi:fumarate hydratase subunit alpha
MEDYGMPRELAANAITESVRRLVLEANRKLPAGVLRLLEQALEKEESEIGSRIIASLIENAKLAERENLPICQDTGMAVVFCELGQAVCITGGDFEDAINEGVRRGYADGFLRMSVVRDPVRRGNTEDNTPAVIYTRIVPGDGLHITVCPKGFGSKNTSRIKMFNPTAEKTDIERFIAQTVIDAGSGTCPPGIIGVGLGGTLDLAAVEAKRALTRPAEEPNPDPYYAEMEENILRMINDSGVGPMGLGGRVTALRVAITPLPTHIAGMPCVVNTCCHAARHAEVLL